MFNLRLIGEKNFFLPGRKKNLDFFFRQNINFNFTKKWAFFREIEIPQKDGYFFREIEDKIR